MGMHEQPMRGPRAVGEKPLDAELRPGTRLSVEGMKLDTLLDGAEVMLNYKGRKVACMVDKDGPEPVLVVL